MHLRKKIKIGFCDSGVGGLILAIDFIRNSADILRSIHVNYGIEFEFYHYGEGFPYGNKNDEEILVLGSKMIHKLHRDIGCQIIVVGCNTLSAKLDLYNITFGSDGDSSFNVVSIVRSSADGIYKSAFDNAVRNNDKNIEILMLATPAAFRDNLHDRYIKYAHHKAQRDCGVSMGLVVKSFCPNIYWQERVESGTWHDQLAIDAATRDVKRFLHDSYLRNINAIGFFCTHYPAYIHLLNVEDFDKSLVVSQGKLISCDILSEISKACGVVDYYDRVVVTSHGIKIADFICIFSLYKSEEYSKSIISTIDSIFGSEYSDIIEIMK